MIKYLLLFLLLGFQVSCESDDDEPIVECDRSYTQSQILPVYEYIYATENTEPACYEHGLKVVELKNSYYNNNYNYDGCGGYYEYTSPEYRKNNSYRMDTLPSKFINDIESLNAAEVEELTNLVCGRKLGNENFKIQSLDNFDLSYGEMRVEFTSNNESQMRVIRSYRDDDFDCPLYSFNCYEEIPAY